VKKTLLYPEVTVYRKLPLNYAAMHPEKTTFIFPEETIQASYKIETKNAYVSPFGIVYKNGLVLKESVYSMFKPHKQQLSFFKKMVFNKVKHIPGDCIVAHNAYYENYFHWLLEIVPRMYVYREQAKDLTLIITDFKLPHFAREFIALFGFKDVVYLKEDELAKAERLHFATHMSRGLAFNPTVTQEMKTWLQQKLLNDSYPAAGEKLFISRRNAAFRKTIHEDALAEFLRQEGFITYDVTAPSIQEQANFFKNARYIIGSHGAGFSNMIYSNSCKLIMDIIHEDTNRIAFITLLPYSIPIIIICNARVPASIKTRITMMCYWIYLNLPNYITAI
jgi:capsular polysaccharide biosynthesis protein